MAEELILLLGAAVLVAIITYAVRRNAPFPDSTSVSAKDMEVDGGNGG
jgi:hypothetical protein